MQRLAFAFLALVLALPLAHAAVPHEKAVPAYAEEQTILQREQGLPGPGLLSRESGRHHFDRHFIVPLGRMPEQNVILQRGGNTWRVLRNGPIATTSAVLLLGALLVLAVVHGVRRRPPERPRAGAPTVRRFNRGQRIVHWSVAITFVALALTGLITLFGKQVLLPWMGHDVFSWLAVASKYLHNVAGPIFVVLSVVMFAAYVRHNLFRRHDWTWLRTLGGLRSRGPAPAGYFNAGEKLWFWFGLTALGLLMGATGLVLDFPYLGDVGATIGFTRYQQQWADYLHIAGATFYIAGAFGHIYLGTAVSPQAWHAMRHGDVDVAWAREHHPLWLDEARPAGGPRG